MRDTQRTIRAQGSTGCWTCSAVSLCAPQRLPLWRLEQTHRFGQTVRSVVFNPLLRPKVYSTGGICVMRSDAQHLVSSQQRCVHQTILASKVGGMNCSEHVSNSAHAYQMHQKG